MVRKAKSGKNGQKDNLSLCAFPGCDNEHHAKGYCKRCYGIMRRSSEAEFAQRVAQARKETHRSGRSKSTFTKAERLELIKQRYAIHKREIEAIRKSLETDD